MKFFILLFALSFATIGNAKTFEYCDQGLCQLIQLFPNGPLRMLYSSDDVDADTIAHTKAELQRFGLGSNISVVQVTPAVYQQAKATQEAEPVQATKDELMQGLNMNKDEAKALYTCGA